MMRIPRSAALIVAGLALVLSAPLAGRQAEIARAGGSPAEVAFQAALEALNGVPPSQCTADGQFPPPGRDTCVSMSPEQAAQADRGLVAVQAFLAPDIQPVFAVVGRGTDGAWGLWFAAPAAAVPVRLPADARACGDGGARLRSGPSSAADVVALLPADTIVSVDRFVLARPGTWSRDEPAVRGEGWYHVAGPRGEWISGGSVVVADGDCEMALG